MMNYLKEEFAMKGTDANEFFALCKDMDDHTVVFKAKSPTLCSFMNENEEDGTLVYNGIKLPFNAFENIFHDANKAEDVYKELIMCRAPVVADMGGSGYLCTNKAIAEIAALRGLHGTPINRPSKARDNYVTELASGLTVTFVGRKVGNITRIMSTRSAKFGNIPMATIKTAYDGFMSSDWIGSYEVKNWEMSQDKGTIYIEFPELANNMRQHYPNMPDTWIPGVVFKNGTTGYCTLGAIMTYRRDGSYDTVEIGEVAAKHFAGFTPETFINKMKNECWGMYTQMPEKLEGMTAVSIAPEDVEKTFEKVFKFIKLNKVFQKKDTETCKYLEKLRDRALLDAKALTNISLYDVVNIVMELPNAISVPDAYKKLLCEACGRAWQYEM